MLMPRQKRPRSLALPAPVPAFRHGAASLLLAGALGLGVPMARGQDNPPPPPASAPAEQMDEVIVTAPRNGEPGFQESDEYHRQEYSRLQAKFGPPQQRPIGRGDETFGVGTETQDPNYRSGLRDEIATAPRLTQTFSEN